MELEITTFFVLSDELMKVMDIKEDSQVKMNNAEVITVPLTAARFFGGHIENARNFLKEHGYITDMLSESRLNRRIHALDDSVWQNLFTILSETAKQSNTTQEYIHDSFPIPVCDNIRINRSKIFKGEEYRGYIPSKRRYFYGLRVHMTVTGNGEPVEFLIAPGAPADISIFRELNFDLPPGSEISADKAYNDYNFEDMLREAVGITLKPIRKKNSVRATDSSFERRGHQAFRKRVETSYSVITHFFPKSIHAVTPKGFILKVIAFIIAFSFTYII